MKRLLPGIASILLSLSSPAWATFTLVQHVFSSACNVSSATCNVTVASTGTGHLILIGMSISNADFITSVSGAGTYTVPGGCEGADSTTSSTSCAYNLSSTSGVTTITVTRTSTTTGTWRCEVLELSSTATPFVLDVVGNRDQSTNTTTPAGVTLTLSGSNDVILQTAQSSTGQTSISINAPYTIETCGANRMCFAWSLNTTSGTAPTWTMASSGHAALGAIAIKETSAATAGTAIPTVQ